MKQLFGKADNNGAGGLLELTSISAHPKAQHVRAQREKVESQYRAAVARLARVKAAYEVVEGEAADRISEGKKVGNEVEEAHSKVVKAEGEARICELAVKRVREREEKVDQELRTELEEAIREMYRQSLKGLNAALELAKERNREVLRVFAKTCELFGPGQYVIPQLGFSALTGYGSESRLKAWQDFIRTSGYMDLD